MFLFLALYAGKMSFMIVQNEKRPFLGHKIKKYKKSKNGDFSKGVSSWFCSKICHFSIFLFLAIQVSKMSFTIVQNEKTPFQAIKSRSTKSRKIEIFPKGLIYGFGQKLAIFPSIYFRQYQPAKCLSRQSRRKNAFLGYKIKK